MKQKNKQMKKKKKKKKKKETTPQRHKNIVELPSSIKSLMSII